MRRRHDVPFVSACESASETFVSISPRSAAAAIDAVAASARAVNLETKPMSGGYYALCTYARLEAQCGVWCH